ncbi:hypothetical protein [Acinetobacter sp.]|uniref:hypothetical protein n=1 Tax=Acinetobacter sp. TaxID=472 RepID=UPI0028AD0BE5|nr:hypothetical protein [Acinetobacter sp.]
MNAIQFIKEHGVEKAREIVEGIPSKYMSCYYSTLCYCTKSNKYSDRFAPRESLVNMGWLKRLVESVDLIGKYHSIDHAKNHYNNMREALNQYQYENKDIEDLSNELEQAIADYEAICGDSK